MEILKMTAFEAGEKIKNKEIGVVEITKATIENIEKLDTHYNAFTSVCKAEAIKQAEKVEKAMENGEMPWPLAGVPMAVKDNMCTEGIESTCASKILQGFKPTFTATAVERLKNLGAIMVGKVNMDEFAMGSTCETSFYGVSKNPWGENRTPGGSSGGSAVAVATDQVFYTLGSDTGGSIRQPASFCGITGLKPTYGAVSRYGLIAYASSLDQIGPMGKTVEDVAEVLTAISGHDSKDSTSAKNKPIKINLEGNINGKRIGVPKEYFGEGLDTDVKEKVLEAVKKLEYLGAIVEEFSMPELKYAVPAYYIIACAEASSNLSRFDGIKYGYSSKNYENLADLYYSSRTEGFGKEVKKRIMIGSFVLSSGYYEAYYIKALKVKAIIKQSFDKAFERYDCILSPTTPTTALKMGEGLKDPLKMYLGDIYTVSVNLAGLPSLVVPCGFDKEGLPVGLQLTGRPFGENVIMNMGHIYQCETGYHREKPNLVKGV